MLSFPFLCLEFKRIPCRQNIYESTLFSNPYFGQVDLLKSRFESGRRFVKSKIKVFGVFKAGIGYDAAFFKTVFLHIGKGANYVFIKDCRLRTVGTPKNMVSGNHRGRRNVILSRSGTVSESVYGTSLCIDNIVFE